jgi:hypothetical protein
MAEQVCEASNPVSPHREPPPSLGMVAHIWGGHLELTDSPEQAEQPGEVAVSARVD